jgi:hypothetical protein
MTAVGIHPGGPINRDGVAGAGIAGGVMANGYPPTLSRFATLIPARTSVGTRICHIHNNLNDHNMRHQRHITESGRFARR